ncbi:MAG: glutathione S-transferase, partial [Pseudomonadota bacterium]|nr:glutathione S-transferase [Pseudomonadota bacterium]
AATLQLIDEALAESQWLAGEEASIADLAIYPYLALSPEGRVDLAPFKNVLRWFGDIRCLDGYVDMPGMYE